MNKVYPSAAAALEGIVRDIMGKMQFDWQENDSSIDPKSLQWEAILGITSDHVVGWRVTFRSLQSSNYCYVPARFGQ